MLDEEGLPVYKDICRIKPFKFTCIPWVRVVIHEHDKSADWCVIGGGFDETSRVLASSKPGK